MNQRSTRVDVIRICRWLSQRALVAADDGAVSTRISSDRLLITPRGRHMEWVRPEELVLLNLKGKKIAGHLQPSLSLNLHLAAYACRADVQALILSQPPAATGFAVAGIPLLQPLIPETVLTLGSVPLAPYGHLHTAMASKTITPLMEHHDAILLKNRGLLVLGPDLWHAVDTLERVEKTANVLLGAQALGHVDLLSGAQILDLMELRAHWGLRGKNPWRPNDREKNGN